MCKVFSDPNGRRYCGNVFKKEMEDFSKSMKVCESNEFLPMHFTESFDEVKKRINPPSSCTTVRFFHSGHGAPGMCSSYFDLAAKLALAPGRKCVSLHSYSCKLMPYKTSVEKAKALCALIKTSNPEAECSVCGHQCTTLSGLLDDHQTFSHFCVNGEGVTIHLPECKPYGSECLEDGDKFRCRRGENELDQTCRCKTRTIENRRVYSCLWEN